MKKRIVAVIILGIMMFTMSPMAFAADTTTGTGEIIQPVKSNAFVSIDADKYNSTESTAVVTKSDNSADLDSAVISAKAGDMLVFDNVDMTNAKALMLVASIPAGSTGKVISLYYDSTDSANLLGTLTTRTAAKVSDLDFNEQYATLSNAPDGSHKLIFKFNDATELEMDWFKLTEYTGSETAEQHNARMEWWRDAHYGQFIHLGAYSYLAGTYNGRTTTSYSEWIMDHFGISKEDYKKDASVPFNPKDFDAKKIVSDAKAAGQKYLIITSRHHEGLSIYDTQIRNFKDYSIFSVSNFGNYDGVDILKELSEECEKQGIVFGVYTTIVDWYDPSQIGHNASQIANGYTKEGYKAQLKGQLKELIEDYGAKVFFFDGHWANWWTTEDGQETYRYILSLDETCIVNNRVGKRARTDGDYDTPEQTIPVTGLDYDWESCVTMNNSWGYAEGDTNWKSAQWIVESVVDITSKGGNLLLNVGPDGNGVVPQDCTDIMTEAGTWFEKFGDAIYGARANCFSSLIANNIRVTTKPGKLYVTLINASPTATGTILLPALENKVLSVKEMANGKDVPYTMVSGKINMDISGTEAHDYATVYEITIEGDAKESVIEDVNLALNKPVTSYSSQWSTSYAASMLTDGKMDKRWATVDSTDFSPWAIVDLGEVKTVGRVELYEWWDNGHNRYRCTGFKISVSTDNQSWTEVYSGTAVGEKLVCKFSEQVPARYIKIHDVKSIAAGQNASFNEMEVYPFGAKPEITITSDKEYVDFPYTIEGTYADAESVELKVYGQSFQPITIQATVNAQNGTWSAVIDDPAIKGGEITVQAYLKDKNGTPVTIASHSFEYTGRDNLALGCKTEHSTQFVTGNGQQLGAQMLVDGYITGVDGPAYRRWAPLDSDKEQWAIIDLGEKQLFNEFELFEWKSTNEPWRCKSFTISVSDDKVNWTPVHVGEGIGEKLTVKLDTPANARYIKLHNFESNVNSAASNISLYEMAVFAPEYPVITKATDNTVSLSSDARRVYWGYIGEENTEYKWFDDFKAECGDTFTSEYTPKANDTYKLTKKGFYRFVVNSDGKDYVYTVECTENDPTAIDMTLSGASAVLSGAARKVYWGYIGEENTPYTWFNDFKAQCGDTFTSDFAPKADKAYRMEKEGYYRFVVNYIENGKSCDKVFTFKCENANYGIPVVEHKDGSITLTSNEAKINKMYIGYFGENEVEIDSWAEYTENAIARACIQTPNDSYTTNLKNEGCYVILVNYTDENGKNKDKYFTFMN